MLLIHPSTRITLADWDDIAAKDRLSRRQQVISEANDADVVRPHQRSGGDSVFASGKYGKVGSRGVARVFTASIFMLAARAAGL